MSGLLSMRRAAAPRHSLRTARPGYQRRILLSRTGALAKNIGLVLVAVVLLFSAVFLLLAATSWASNRAPGQNAGTAF
jgi:hypothetical protein